MQLEYEFNSKFNDRYNTVSRKVLRMLSEDSRTTLTEMSTTLGISRQSVATKLKRLESEFEIEYTIELNEDKLGLINSHLILVKFRKKPDPEILQELFSKSYIPQIVVSIKGDYDLLVVANAISRQDYVKWDKGMQMALADYDVMWQPSEIAHRQLGFCPLRDEIIQKLDIDQRYKTLLLLLNSNSRITFKGISSKTGMHFNTVAYDFEKLKKIGYIKRFTTLMKPIKDVTYMTAMGKYTISQHFEQDSIVHRKALMSDDKNSLISRYLLCVQLIGSGDFFFLGAFDDYDSANKHGIMYYKAAQKRQKVKVKKGTIDQILIGKLPIRSIDTSKEYNTVKWDLSSVQST